MEPLTHDLHLWGFGGAFFAAVFAFWMFFFPKQVITHFAWPAEPRLTQVFIGVGYVFRAGFFLSVALEPAWHRVEWIFWGNLVFTGVLLLATFWHADRFSWFFATSFIWLFLYVVEPVTMVYLAPHVSPAAATTQSTVGAAILPAFKWLLVAEVMIFGTVGALLVINPYFMDTIWPWPLNPLDARIMAAWFLGWATWAGGMAFAPDWDAIRIAAQLQILVDVALLGTLVVFVRYFDFRRTATRLYAGLIVIFTLATLIFAWLQETTFSS